MARLGGLRLEVGYLALEGCNLGFLWVVISSE